MLDYTRGTIVPVRFNTHTAGVPTTLAGSPALRVWRGTSTTQISAGVSAITVDAGGITGAHTAAITTTDLATYIPGNTFFVHLSAGTVSGDSQIGQIVYAFTIEAGHDLHVFQGTAIGVAAGAMTGDANDTLAQAGDYILSFIADTGAGQWRQIIDVTGGVFTLDRDWDPEPTGALVYKRFPGSLGVTKEEGADAVLDAAEAAQGIHTHVRRINEVTLTGDGVVTPMGAA